MENSAHSPNSQMQEILDVYGEFKTPPLESLSAENARNLPTFADAVTGVIGKHILKRANPFPEVVGQIAHQLIPGPGGDLLARIYYPKSVDKVESEERLPVLLYFHGGGWVIANLDTYDSSCRALCNESGFMVVSVAYRQAPEHPFPAAIDDAFAAYKWLLNHASLIGGDRSRIAIAGESAGGNLAAVTCLRAKAEGIPLPIHQLLVYPVTDLTFSGESHREHADAKPLNHSMMAWFKKYYWQGKTDLHHPYLSPIFAPDLKGLPSATVITAELDPLRSEGEAYAQKLEDAGVMVTFQNFEGVAHEFFGASAVLDDAREAVALAAQELKKCIGGDLGINISGIQDRYSNDDQAML